MWRARPYYLLVATSTRRRRQWFSRASVVLRLPPLLPALLLLGDGLPCPGTLRVPSEIRTHDPLLRRSVCAAGQPACSQVRRRIRLSASDRKFPPLTGRSGTQRARHLLLSPTPGSSAPWSSSPPSELRITRVFAYVARGFKVGASFMFAGCCWWRSLAVDGSSGASQGHAPAMRRPGSRWDGAIERPSASGCREYSYGGFGGGHPHFNPHAVFGNAS